MGSSVSDVSAILSRALGLNVANNTLAEKIINICNNASDFEAFRKGCKQYGLIQENPLKEIFTMVRAKASTPSLVRLLAFLHFISFVISVSMSSNFRKMIFPGRLYKFSNP